MGLTLFHFQHSVNHTALLPGSCESVKRLVFQAKSRTCAPNTVLCCDGEKVDSLVSTPLGSEPLHEPRMRIQNLQQVTTELPKLGFFEMACGRFTTPGKSALGFP
jgi:hypothetical protein